MKKFYYPFQMMCTCGGVVFHWSDGKKEGITCRKCKRNYKEWAGFKLPKAKK